MKKNTMMRLASVLLICVLLTTSTISGTFAKYITTDSADATARVAKWGIEIDSAADALFAKTYARDDLGTVIENTVEADVEVVAPGTKSADNAITFGVTGTPEVAVRMTVKIEDGCTDVYLPAKTNYDDRTTADSGDTFTTDDYYPVVYTLKVPTTGGGTETVIGNLNAIKTFLNSYFVDFEPGTNLEEKFTEACSLSWAWTFETGNDEADTLLGDIAAGKATVDGASTRIDFTMTVTATQID